MRNLLLPLLNEFCKTLISLPRAWVRAWTKGLAASGQGLFIEGTSLLRVTLYLAEQSNFMQGFCHAIIEQGTPGLVDGDHTEKQRCCQFVSAPFPLEDGHIMQQRIVFRSNPFFPEGPCTIEQLFRLDKPAWPDQQGRQTTEEKEQKGLLIAMLFCARACW